MIFCRGVSGFVTGCPCGVWGRGKSIPNKLVCKFDRMENSSSLSCKICIDSTCWYLLCISVCYIVILTSQTAFKLTLVLSSSISHRRHLYSNGPQFASMEWSLHLKSTKLPTWLHLSTFYTGLWTFRTMGHLKTQNRWLRLFVRSTFNWVLNYLPINTYVGVHIIMDGCDKISLIFPCPNNCAIKSQGINFIIDEAMLFPHMMTSSDRHIFYVTGGIHRSPVNSPQKGRSREALMFYFDLCLNKRLSKQWWGWWFDAPIMTSL